MKLLETLLNIQIKKGPRIKINQIDFEGNESIATKKMKRLMKNTKVLIIY